jgi:homogentisate 1,2-dioxygenase
MLNDQKYYHRNMATEIVGIIYGSYKGTSRDLQAGGLSYQSSYMPHGGMPARVVRERPQTHVLMTRRNPRGF